MGSEHACALSQQVTVQPGLKKKVFFLGFKGLRIFRVSQESERPGILSRDSRLESEPVTVRPKEPFKPFCNEGRELKIILHTSGSIYIYVYIHTYIPR